ncbi:hypothetical protein ACE8EZ_20600 [Pantoea deleyi]|uniref:hypothetical protein n=1 Tax=Pantoea deleyi TaxID=470932 RepID=UPI0035D412BB
MNTQNVNTAASESTETGVEGQEKNGLDPALAQSLDYLKLLKSKSMNEEERFELLTGTLLNMAEQICNTVTDWSHPRPMIPLASFKAWIEAAHIVHVYPDGAGDTA